MVEPPVAARSKTPVRSNLRLATCLAPLEAWIALRSTVQSAGFTVYAGTKIGHANTARREANRNRLTILRGKLIEC